MAGEFDILALRLRVDEWRDEAERVPAGPMREFCLREACRYERRLRASANTPIIHERGIGSGWSAKGPHSKRTPASGQTATQLKVLGNKPMVTINCNVTVHISFGCCM
jgi:hypothetical protein